jgi:hypothetical protein
MKKKFIMYSMVGRGPEMNLVQFYRSLSVREVELFIHEQLIQGGDDQPVSIRMVTRGGATIEMEIMP